MAKAAQAAAKRPITARAGKKAPGKSANRLAPARVRAILDGLARAYPEAECALKHNSAWQLLVATILSAQCTDVRVNMVTPELFREYPNIEVMAAATPESIEPLIRTTGFYHNKAKSIVGAARRVRESYHGRVPDVMDELLTLPGVARKTANVVLGVWFKKATGVVVDTHVTRVSQRLELTRNTAPEKIERDLMRIVAEDQWIAFSHRTIWHGRLRCIARKPRCIECPIEKLCYSSDKTFSSNS